MHLAFQWFSYNPFIIDCNFLLFINEECFTEKVHFSQDCFIGEPNLRSSIKVEETRYWWACFSFEANKSSLFSEFFKDLYIEQREM